MPATSFSAGPKASAIVVMGVCGCGKSTVARALADALQLRMLDGDDLHEPRSVDKMRSGIPLEDADRLPWLDRVGNYLAAVDEQSPRGRVVACSALKRAYRDRIRRICPAVCFVFLDGEPELIRQRMAQRVGHYMHTGLLASQLQALERPQADEADVISLDIRLPLPRLVALSISGLGASPATA